MSKAHFPDLIRQLPDFDGPFDAHQLAAKDCDVLFASYPAGTSIEIHSHPTENVGVITEGELFLTMAGKETRYCLGDWYHIDADQQHAARTAVSTSVIEFWFSS